MALVVEQSCTLAQAAENLGVLLSGAMESVDIFIDSKLENTGAKVVGVRSRLQAGT